MMIALAVWKCRHIRNTRRTSLREKLRAFVGALPALATPVVILGASTRAC